MSEGIFSHATTHILYSDGKPDYQRSHRVSFHNLGIGGSNFQEDKKNWTVKTLRMIRKELGHTKVSFANATTLTMFFLIQKVHSLGLWDYLNMVL